MKMVYERPMMMAEVYATNAYCNACGTILKNGILTTDDKHAYRNTGKDTWQPALGFTKDDLSHTFKNDNIYQTVEGNCNNGCSDASQSIWRCTCDDHPGETWYLEYSHYYSAHTVGTPENPVPTFCLYKDADNDGKFDIIHFANDFPAIENGSDYNVAVVIYTEGESVVSNS